MLSIQNLFSGHPTGGHVLNGLNLEVPNNKIICIVGRNGMGKTTLLKTICGILAVTDGQIYLEQNNITALPAYSRARLGIGYVPQGREVFAEFTVEKNLLVGRIAKPGAPPKIQEHLFELFPILAERKNQKAGTLSGGQQQQLAIARALAGEPKLLLLDEPAEGIQPSIVKEIGTTLRRLVEKENLTILMAEQSLEMVENVAHQVAFIEHGKIMEANINAKDLRAKPELLAKYLSI